MAQQSAVSDAEAAEDISADNGRILSLSDGVFAFAMTLMVLQFDTPSPERVAAGKLARSVIDHWPSLISYTLTFSVVANYWVVHHRTFHFIKAHDAGLIWINIAFLLCVSFLPFPTDVMGEYDRSGFAAGFYSACMVLTSAILTLMWWYVSRQRRLMHDNVNERMVRYYLLRGFTTSGVFLLSIPLAAVNVDMTRCFWLVLIPAHHLLAGRYRDVGGRIVGF